MNVTIESNKMPDEFAIDQEETQTITFSRDVNRETPDEFSGIVADVLVALGYSLCEDVFSIVKYMDSGRIKVVLPMGLVYWTINPGPKER